MSSLKRDKSSSGWVIRSRQDYKYVQLAGLIDALDDGYSIEFTFNDGALLSRDAAVIEEPLLLAKGIYRIEHRHGETLVTPYIMTELDRYIDLDRQLDQVKKEIAWFLASEQKYQDAGLAWRRGLMLYGPPGTGKTRMVMEMACDFAKDHWVFLLGGTGSVQAAIEAREALANCRPAMIVIEEMTEAIGNNAQPLLNFLDGVDSWTKCLTLGTTNYPEKLAANIIDRPSRFDRLYFVDNPDSRTRRLYLENFLPAEEVTPKLIEATASMSIAYLKEIVVHHKLMGGSFQETLEEILARRKEIKKNFSTAKPVGFGGKYDDVFDD